MHRDVIYPSAPPDLAAKCAYYTIAFPFIYTFVTVFGLILTATTASLLIILPLIAIAIIGTWIVAVLILFVLWFGFYRYPVYEVFCPRLKQWILKHNSVVYSPIISEVATIRVVRLKPGNRGDPIECDLIHQPLAELSFEALSYVWGTALTPYQIKVDGKPFYVTYNLHSALQELRSEDKDRTMWIDAMCINQGDNAEKSSQVQLMRDIYAKAIRVVVWLGESEKTTSDALELAREFENIGHDSEDAWWDNLTDSLIWQKLWKTFRSMIEHEWWTRAWIIQEVVVAKSVVVQLGSQHIDWDVLSKFIACEPFRDQFPEVDTPLFAEDIQKLRLGVGSDEAISNTLFGLTFRFRYQSATLGSDKIYALLGLLKSDNPTLLVPDYNQSPDDVFLNFLPSCLESNKNLTAVALAAGVELQGTSWCRDWRFNHDGQFETMHFCTFPPLDGPDYAASGNQIPIFEADLPRRTLSLKGYEVDAIVQIGQFHQESSVKPVDWLFVLEVWEHLAGGPWQKDCTRRQAFYRTITGNNWSYEQLDWRPRVQRRGKPPRNQEEWQYLNIVDRVCRNRRFFITKNGRFGLGPWNLQTGDIVCILLGGKTPFILRPCKTPHDGATAREYYKVVGETFVDGLMYYQGCMQNDIEQGKIVPRWYHLL